MFKIRAVLSVNNTCMLFVDVVLCWIHGWKKLRFWGKSFV